MFADRHRRGAVEKENERGRNGVPFFKKFKPHEMSRFYQIFGFCVVIEVHNDTYLVDLSAKTRYNYMVDTKGENNALFAD